MNDKINRSVERVSASYAYTKTRLETLAHACTWDHEGRCLYCPKRAVLSGPRTGELMEVK